MKKSVFLPGNASLHTYMIHGDESPWLRYTYLGILVGRLPMAQVGPLRECRCPGVVHTGDLPPVSVVIQVGTTISALCFL